MRMIYAILSFYMLALTIMPCTDIKDAKHETCYTADADKDVQDHETHSENCSPFCGCSCCGSDSLVMFSLSQINIITQTCRQTFRDLPCAVSKISLPIWQPPKITNSFFA